MHVKPDPVTEICFVCSASAAVRAQPRSEPPGMCSVMVGFEPPTPLVVGNHAGSPMPPGQPYHHLRPVGHGMLIKGRRA